MMKKALFGGFLLLLSLAVALSAAALAEDAAAQDAPEEYAVRVGDVCFSRELVQFSYVSVVDALLMQGETISEEEAMALRDDSIKHFVQLGVIDNKLHERGLDEFSEDDLAYYRDYARQTYEAFWQNIYQQISASDSSVTEEQVSDWLNTHGYTVDMFYEDALGAARMGRAVDNYCQTTSVSIDELVDFYTEHYVQPDREKYENDVKRYEEEILLQNTEAFFTPSGYRYIKQILLPIPDDIQAKLNEINARGAQANKLLEEAYNALAQAAASGEDIAPHKAAYDERAAAVEACGKEYETELRAAVPALKEKTDEIYSRYEAGESFETLMADYSVDSLHQQASDPGYLFHPESENWAGDFHDAAAALEKPGDVSQPVATTAGVHIICYMSDAPSGVHQLTDLEQQALESTALQEKQLDELSQLIDVWVAEYDVETHPDMIDISEYLLGNALND